MPQEYQDLIIRSIKEDVENVLPEEERGRIALEELSIAAVNRGHDIFIVHLSVTPWDEEFVPRNALAWQQNILIRLHDQEQYGEPNPLESTIYRALRANKRREITVDGKSYVCATDTQMAGGSERAPADEKQQTRVTTMIWAATFFAGLDDFYVD